MKNLARDSFEAISLDYERGVYDAGAESLFTFLQKNYYARLAGKRVLDIGNGGVPPSKILGQEIGSRPSLFVGMDNSWAMIRRTKHSYHKIMGEGQRLSFGDRVFDYVILNGVFHHLGFCRRENPFTKVADLLKETVRVCRNEIIIYEPFLPPFLEKLEKLIANVLGEMSPFVYSEETLASLISRMGLARTEVVTMSQADFLGPFHWDLVVMKYPWFKVPAFLSPIRHGFFVISCEGSIQRGRS